MLLQFDQDLKQKPIWMVEKGYEDFALSYPNNCTNACRYQPRTPSIYDNLGLYPFKNITDNIHTHIMLSYIYIYRGNRISYSQ